MSSKMSFVAFSGTADKLQALATMVSGAAAMEVETHVFLTFWGVMALRKDSAGKPLPLPTEYGEQGEQILEIMSQRGVTPFADLLRLSTAVGDVHIHACAMTTDLFNLEKDDLDDMVEDIIGVGSFIQLAEGGSVVFI